MPKPIKKHEKNPAAWIPKTVRVLGTKYEIIIKQEKDDPELARKYGYIWYRMYQIIIEDLYKDLPDEPIQALDVAIKNTLRHEILHAFLFESGLCESSLQYSAGWARNEEMVDWFALQAPKIFETYKIVGCL